MEKLSLKSTMESVVNALCADNNVFVVWEKEGTVPYAEMGKRTIHIPIDLTSTDLDEDTSIVLKHNCYHELAHIIFTQEKYILKITKTLHSIWNAVEDLWIERGISDVFAGIKKVINTGNKITFGKILDRVSKEPIDSWEGVLISLMSVEFGFQKLPMTEKGQELFDKAYPIFKTWKESSGTNDNLEIAKKIYEIWKDDIKETESSSKEVSGFKGDKDSKGEPIPNQGKNLLQEEIDSIIQKVKELKDSGCLYTAYRDEDVYSSVKPSENGRVELLNIRSQIGRASNSLISKLQQRFEALINSETCSGKEFGKINKRMLPQICFGLRKDVFEDVEVGRGMNTAVSIAVDQSGSMRRIENEVKKTLVILGDALNRMEIPFEIFATSTKDPHTIKTEYTRFRSMIFSIFKRFGDNWNTTAPSIPAFHRMENHIDGESLEFAFSNIRDREEVRKVIFVITDGETYSGQDEISNGKISQNLNRVIQRVRKAGVEVYAISINCSGPEKYYGEKFTARIEIAKDGSFGNEVLTKISNIIMK